MNVQMIATILMVLMSVSGPLYWVHKSHEAIQKLKPTQEESQ